MIKKYKAAQSPHDGQTIEAQPLFPFILDYAVKLAFKMPNYMI
jgi:hypothetical protein